MEYVELGAKRQKRINDLPMHFAFGQANFQTKLKELGVTKDDIVAIGGGGFMLKSEHHLLDEAYKLNEKENEEFFATDEGLLSALSYELGNHEFVITRDPSDALRALGLSRKDDRVERLLQIAMKEQLDWYKANG